MNSISNKKLKERISAKYLRTLIVMTFFLCLPAFIYPVVTITSAVSAKGNCYVAGGNLTITINATNPTSWAALHAMVIGSVDTVLDHALNGGGPDDGLFGMAGAGDTCKPSWASTLLLAAGANGGTSVTGYQLIVPVPLSYTTGGTGTRTFIVATDNTSAGLTIGQYYSSGFNTAYITLPECSLDTPTVTFTSTPTVPHICNTGFSDYGATAIVCVNITNNTPTNTPTKTSTATFTNTYTYTATPTNTSTKTFTFTSTDTPTSTATPTFTFTATNTATPTQSFTFTNTNTSTATPTFTFTSTKTATPTQSFTFTNTNTSTATPTFTYTFTSSSTSTKTDTPTQTSTFTSSYTKTATPTSTATPTNTSTYTVTSTFTDTYTSSATPTVTPTSPPYPYLLKIAIYNEAGELVRNIGSSPTNNSINQIILSTGGQTNVTLMTTQYPLSIYLPGIETPNNAGSGGTDFIWNAVNNANQTTGNGVYYIKFEELDMYGHTNVLIKEITVMVVQEYVEVCIFNSAGEKIKSIRDYKDVTNTKISLKVGINDNGQVYVAKGNNNINITYGTNLNEYVIWDGLNDQGIAVTPGSYEVQVSVVSTQGRTVVAAKSIVLLSEKITYMKGVSIQPNPYSSSIAGLKQIKFAWVSGIDTGWMNVTVYSMFGEKIRTLNATLESGFVVWDIKNIDNSRVSTGYYVVVFESKNSTGHFYRNIAKLAILGKR